jgi:epoxyqueuosine reductase
MFPKSNVKRTGRERFIRNVLIAIGNSGDVGLAPDAERLLDDPSPLIRGAAVWALSQLLPREAFVAMRREDVDVGVMEEWRAAAG